MMFSLFILCLAYLIGSIPSGYLIAKWQGIKDIRLHGSGNIGATNVARMLGTRFFLIVFFLDCLKSYLFLKLLDVFGFDLLFLCGASILLLIGNGASIFLQLRGGKGIATGFGILLAVKPWLLMIMLPIWFTALSIFRVIGIASIISMLALPIIIIYCGAAGPIILLTLFISAWCLYMHRDNLIRFIAQ